MNKLNKCGTSRDDFDEILAIIEKYDALNYVRHQAEIEAQKAIDALSVVKDSPYKTALIALAQLSVKRDH